MVRLADVKRALERREAPAAGTGTRSRRGEVLGRGDAPKRNRDRRPRRIPAFSTRDRPIGPHRRVTRDSGRRGGAHTNPLARKPDSGVFRRALARRHASPTPKSNALSTPGGARRDTAGRNRGAACGPRSRRGCRSRRLPRGARARLARIGS